MVVHHRVVPRVAREGTTGTARPHLITAMAAHLHHRMIIGPTITGPAVAIGDHRLLPLTKTTLTRLLAIVPCLLQVEDPPEAPLVRP